jgi:hypothetical protein
MADLEHSNLDGLGTWALHSMSRFQAVGLTGLHHETCSRACLHPNVGSLPHPAAHLLDYLRRTGAAAIVTSPPLTLAEKDAAVARGCHQSAREHVEFLRTEIWDYAKKGYFLVLPYQAVRHIKNLRLAPMGVVPQRNRRPRAIVDYTWNGVNDDTLRLAPESMQFGRALQRLLQRIYDANPRFGPVYMAKYDVADGFYRVRVNLHDAPNLGILLPRIAGEEPLVAIPTVLPMGWVESPPYFCAATETVCDLANAALQQPHLIPLEHRLDAVANTPPAPSLEAQVPSIYVPPMHPPAWRSRRTTPEAYADLYMDDFCGLAQGPPARRNAVRRAILSSLDKVIRPVDAEDSPLRKEPASVKKMLEGDGAWAHRKVLLGWAVDTIKGTIELPPHRKERLEELVKGCLSKQRLSLKKWHRLLGELRSMSLALPGSEGLFAPFQAALTKATATSQQRIRVTRPVRDALADWEWLAANIFSRPTSIAEVVRKPVSLIGACDASAAGMGGIWLDPSSNSHPLCWRAKFPESLTANLVSFDNPDGTITNSDLELAAVVAQHDILSNQAPAAVLHQNIAVLSDNTPTVAWALRGSVSHNNPSAYLLRLLALHRRHYRYTSLIAHVPGRHNSIADDCSRLWHLSDNEFLAHLSLAYPQEKSWQLCPLRPGTSSALTSALCKQRLKPALWLARLAQPDASGSNGWSFVPPSKSTHGSNPSATLSQFYKSSLGESAPVSSLSAELRYSHVLQRRTSELLARRSPAWGPTTQGSTVMAN